MKRNEGYIHVDAKSPSFSSPEEFSDAKTGLNVMKENSHNKTIVELLSIFKE